MVTIGITGGVGSGKSSVLNYIQQRYSAYIILADEVGHKLMQPGGVTYEKLIDVYGDDILKEDRTINKQKLADIVFTDQESVQKMNALTHPLICKAIEKEIEQIKQSGKYSFLFLETAILEESGMSDACDWVWYIHVPDEIRIERLMKSRGYSKEKCKAIMKQQLNEEKFRKIADYVIENGGDFEETKAQIHRLLG
ncbi:MAG: dephospho-CoA kinase [Clostridiales bacterium]|nr:dephospho-CoA kinase [Clostridiales bacterium]